MKRLKRMVIWLMRCHHCCGFGVQSPHDYRFVRNVINEHAQYYAYAQLRREKKELDSLQRKKAELYFRLANWQQPRIACVTITPESYIPYLKAGKLSVMIQRDKISDSALPDMLIASFGTMDMSCLLSYLDTAKDGDLLIVEDIHRRNDKKSWNQLLCHQNSTIAFDLYYLGIILVQPSRYKERYIVNF